MSVYKINNDLPITNKISTLSDQVLEVNGKTSKGQFDKNELDYIYNDSGLDRKYLRNVSLGHSLTTYTGWSHIHAESGYSIWKYSPTSYQYDSENQLLLDNKELENRGEADAESATTFDSVFLYNGDSGTGYINNSTEAGTEDGVGFELMDSSNDYLYVGLSSTFTGISFEFEDRGSNYTLFAEYWNGVTWTDLDISATAYGDDTSNFESDGRIYFEAPTNWATTAVNSTTKYWVRLSTTTEPVTVAKAFLIVPANSVPNLLKLSSSEILNEEWAWCSYGTAIYVTIRNSGKSAYEGNYYITSASTAINKQNYFIHNHEFISNYADSTYVRNSIFGYFLAPVIDKDTQSPPLTPTIGDRYLIETGISATDWAAYDGYIGEYTASGWSYTAPLEGMIVYIKDENTWYSYDGSSWGKAFNATGQIFLSGAGGWNSTTSGCSVNTKQELATNKVNLYTLDFDASTEEYAEWSIIMPTDWNGGVITAKFYWMHGATTTNFAVRWGLRGRCFDNNEALDGSWGTRQEVVDTGGVTNNLYISDNTPNITILGAGANKFTQFRAARIAADGTDTLAVDAKLLGIMITYVRS